MALVNESGNVVATVMRQVTGIGIPPHDSF